MSQCTKAKQLETYDETKSERLLVMKQVVVNLLKRELKFQEYDEIMTEAQPSMTRRPTSLGVLASTRLWGLFPRADEIAKYAKGEINYIRASFDTITDDLRKSSSLQRSSQESSSRSDLEFPMRDLDILSTISSQASDEVMNSQHSLTDITEMPSTVVLPETEISSQLSPVISINNSRRRLLRKLWRTADNNGSFQ